MIVRASYKVNLLALGLVCNHYVTDVLCLSNVALLRDSVALQKESFPNKHCTCRTYQKSAWIQSRTHCACMKKVRHVCARQPRSQWLVREIPGNEAGRQIRGLRWGTFQLRMSCTTVKILSGMGQCNGALPDDRLLFSCVSIWTTKRYP